MSQVPLMIIAAAIVLAAVCALSAVLALALAKAGVLHRVRVRRPRRRAKWGAPAMKQMIGVAVLGAALLVPAIGAAPAQAKTGPCPTIWLSKHRSVWPYANGVSCETVSYVVFRIVKYGHRPARWRCRVHSQNRLSGLCRSRSSARRSFGWYPPH
jgi:hypothetical protein